MHGIARFGSASCRYEPAQWLARGKASNVGTFDWSAWPGLVAQWDRDSNAGLELSQVPPGLTTVAWYWRCRNGHRWREPLSSRVVGYPSRPPRWKALARSWTACRQCVLERYGLRYVECGHVHPDLSLISDPQNEHAGKCPRCSGKRRLPEPGTVIRTNYDPPVSKEEGRLRAMLERRIPLVDPLVANAIVVPKTSWGARWIYPDMMDPGFRIAIEYDSPGPSGKAHGKASHDKERDIVLRSLGWEVIRIRVGGLSALGPYDVIARSPNAQAADAAAGQYRRILMRRARSGRRRTHPRST